MAAQAKTGFKTSEEFVPRNKEQQGIRLDFGYGSSSNGASQGMTQEQQPAPQPRDYTLRSQMNKEMTIDIPDFLKNRK